MAINNTYMCLDVGEKRIGVATASSLSRIAQPHSTLAHDQDTFATIDKIVTEMHVSRLIVGLPRNMHGEDTAQTQYIRNFTDTLQHHIRNVNIEFQDEAQTSQKARTELHARKKPYEKGDIDAVAATYILQDYLDQHMGAAL